MCWGVAKYKEKRYSKRLNKKKTSEWKYRPKSDFKDFDLSQQEQEYTTAKIDK